MSVPYDAALPSKTPGPSGAAQLAEYERRATAELEGLPSGAVINRAVDLRTAYAVARMAYERHPEKVLGGESTLTFSPSGQPQHDMPNGNLYEASQWTLLGSWHEQRWFKAAAYDQGTPPGAQVDQRLVAYHNKAQDQLVVGLSGSQSTQNWMEDDVRLFLGMQPATQGWIESARAELQHLVGPSTTWTWVGHSLGAVRATNEAMRSGDYAIGFDLPPYAKALYNDTDLMAKAIANGFTNNSGRLLAVQSSANLVNSSASALGGIPSQVSVLDLSKYGLADSKVPWVRNNAGFLKSHGMDAMGYLLQATYFKAESRIGERRAAQRAAERAQRMALEEEDRMVRASHARAAADAHLREVLSAIQERDAARARDRLRKAQEEAERRGEPPPYGPGALSPKARDETQRLIADASLYRKQGEASVQSRTSAANTLITPPDLLLASQEEAAREAAIAARRRPRVTEARVLSFPGTAAKQGSRGRVRAISAQRFAAVGPGQTAYRGPVAPWLRAYRRRALSRRSRRRRRFPFSF